MSERYPQPNPENEHRLSEGIDFYKLTMGQIALEKFAGTEVTFTFKNRDTNHPISEFVTAEALKNRLDKIREQGFTAEELTYLSLLSTQDMSPRFDTPYLEHLENIKLPEVNIEHNDETG
jgi:nicotinic acid phosphoribosyltransferase